MVETQTFFQADVAQSLRILHICGTFAPDYGGGASETTKDIAVLQSRAGHEVSILCCSPRPGIPYDIIRERQDELTVLRVLVPDWFHQDPEGFLLGWAQRRQHDYRIRELMAWIATEIQPEIVDYHVNRPLGEEALLALSDAGVPIVASLHDFWMICPRVTFMRSPMNQPCTGPGALRCALCMYSHYDGTILSSLPKLSWRVPRLGLGIAWKMYRRRLALGSVRGGMARSGALSDAHATHIDGPCRPILHGISSPVAPQPRQPTEAVNLRFGFFGGSAPDKGLADVLTVLARLRAGGHQAELHVFGPGDVDPGPGLIVHGQFSSTGREAAYSMVDVAVMATRMVEPRGRIPEEASAWGVPSIVPRIGGLLDVVRDEVDGLLFRFRDVGDLERQMKRVLAEPGLLERLRSNLRPPPQLRDSLEQIDAMYRRAIAATPKRRWS